jgi:hypothetical protein
LLESQLEPPRVDAFGFLPEEPLAEYVKLMAKRRVLALCASELGLPGGDHGLSRGEIGETAGPRASDTRACYAKSIRRYNGTEITPRVRTTADGASERCPRRRAAARGHRHN